VRKIYGQKTAEGFGEQTGNSQEIPIEDWAAGMGAHLPGGLWKPPTQSSSRAPPAGPVAVRLLKIVGEA